jgi:hypothetical protein
VRSFRSNLRLSVAASAAPYGYTITIWSSGAVSMSELGVPDLPRALLFMAGAVAAFALVEMAAYGALGVKLVVMDQPHVAIWAHAHIGAAGLAITSVWLAVKAIDAAGAWLAAGFLATAIYLLLNALQLTLAASGGEA